MSALQICELLRKVETRQTADGFDACHVCNPDGAVAADVIERLHSALNRIANDPYRYGLRVQNMKRIASDAIDHPALRSRTNEEEQMG